MITTTKNAHILRFVAIMVIAVALFAPIPAQAQSATDTAPITYLVQFRPSVTDAERAAWMTNNGAIEIDWMSQISVAKIQLDPNRMSASATDMTAVSFIETDAIVTGEHDVTDPGFLDTDQGYGERLVKLLPAWNVTTGISTTIVAVIDTGINAAHPEFAGRLVPGYDFVNQDDDPTDDNGHGTHVAGIIGAGLDGVGTAGMCPQCRIMAVKVLNNKNAGMWSLVAKGILFAVDHGARVINLSLGAAVSSSTLESAVEYAHTNNVVVIAAAGNNNSDMPFYPAAIPYVIAVSATDRTDQRWPLSNFGDYIDVAAPGHQVYSTYHDMVTTNGYAFMSGTSMAAPFVSGLAGLVISRRPELSGEDVVALITNHADDLGDAGKDVYYGNGRINAFATMVAANDNVEPEPDGTSSPVDEPVDDPVDEPVDEPVVSFNLYLAMVTVSN
jgi:thermitase